MINFKMYTWSYNAGVVSYWYLASLYMETQNICKSCIYNHDKKLSISRCTLGLIVKVQSRIVGY